jgi:hypothetical protein
VIANRPNVLRPGDPQGTTTSGRFQSDVGAKHGSNWTSEKQRGASVEPPD